MTDDLLRSAFEAMREPGQPEPLYRAVERAMAALIGYRLFTLLYVTSSGRQVARVYSSDPASYPVGGRKDMGPTPWGDHVMRGLKPYIGRTAEDIRWAFFDHELIASLGCASVLNMPVVYDGRCIGTMNLLHQAGHYDALHVPLTEPYAALLATPFLKLSES